ncbi:RNA-directed DNA polymerase, eukaryota [Tanacetum coccineum]
MEAIRRDFFNGVQHGEKKITWVKWSKVLASKKYGGLGVSSFYALNRALLFKWVWRFISKDNSLWSRLISSIHGSQFQAHSFRYSSTWNVIVRECFIPFRIYALETNKNCTVADKLQGPFSLSFRRPVRGGAESHQLDQLQSLIGPIILSSLDDRWRWDLNEEGIFRVQDARNLLCLQRWVKSSLSRRGVQISSMMCPLCNNAGEDSSHLFFGCDMAIDITRLVCRWWHLAWTPVGSFSEWLAWFKTIRMGSKVKGLLEGVFYTSWWCLWNFRNQLLFAAQSLRKNVLFDDIISRSFTWSHARCRSKFSLENWLRNPFLISL